MLYKRGGDGYITGKMRFSRDWSKIMPANKNKIRRMQTLIKMMRQNRYPNFTSFMKEMRDQDAAGAYNLSSKTFSRDIADLREEYNAPIHYDSCRKGFYLTDTEWFDEDMMIEPFEMRAAILGEKVAKELFPEPMRGEIEKAVSSLLMRNESGMAEGVDIESFQVLCPEGLPKIDPDVFLAAYDAWEQRKKLKLVYRSSKNHVSEKLFEPHVFAWNGGCWYLKGKVLREDGVKCEGMKIRVLALHRVEKAEIIDSEFYPEPAILEGIKADGLFDFEKYPEVDIEFFAPFAKVIAERYPNAVTESSEKSVRVKLSGLVEYEVLQLIFGARGNVRVHSPHELKVYLRRIADRILDNLKN